MSKVKMITRPHLQHIPAALWQQMVDAGIVTGKRGVKGTVTPFINQAITNELARLNGQAFTCPIHEEDLVVYCPHEGCEHDPR